MFYNQYQTNFNGWDQPGNLKDYGMSCWDVSDNNPHKVSPPTTPQWPEPEDLTTTANSSYDDEHDPFLQRNGGGGSVRCSTFSPQTSSTSAASTLPLNTAAPTAASMQHRRRGSKTSIGSSWSSLFNVQPMVVTINNSSRGGGSSTPHSPSIETTTPTKLTTFGPRKQHNNL